MGDGWGSYTPPSSRGNGFAIGAFACGGIAFLFFPIIFGPVAIILAGVSLSRAEPLAKPAMGVAVAGTIVGMVLGMVVIGLT